jgi:hemerythrin superfamily protein
MHLQDMNRMGAFLEHLKQGKMTPAEFSNRIKDSELSKNMKMFGTLCGRECQVLNFHHDAEEQMIFPELERQNIAALSRVVERLRQEHFVVHELLRRLDVAADKLLQDTSTGNFDEITQVFEQLHKVVKSHFGYEETELRDALGKYVPVI